MSLGGDVGVSIKDGCITTSMLGSSAILQIPAVNMAAGSGATGVQASQLANDVLQYAQVTLSSAQILALNTTPISLVAAPGSGKVILPVSLYATLTYVSATYSANAAGFTVRYTNASGASTAMTLTQAFVQSSASAMFAIVAGATAITPVANAAIVVYADTANPTTGDSAIKIQIYYRVVSNPAF